MFGHKVDFDFFHCKILWSSKISCTIWSNVSMRIHVWIAVVCIAIIINTNIMAISEYWSVTTITINGVLIFLLCAFILLRDRVYKRCWVLHVVVIDMIPWQWSVTTKDITIVRMNYSKRRFLSITYSMECWSSKSISCSFP